MEKALPNSALSEQEHGLDVSSVLLEFSVSVLFSEECISFADAGGSGDNTHFCPNGIQY